MIQKRRSWDEFQSSPHRHIVLGVREGIIVLEMGQIMHNFTVTWKLTQQLWMLVSYYCLSPLVTNRLLSQVPVARRKAVVLFFPTS